MMDIMSYNLFLDEDSPNSFDIELVFDDDLDINGLGSISNEGTILHDLAFYYDFQVYANLNNVFSLYNIPNACNTGTTINDFGLTGVDTGYVQNLSGETITFTSASTLVIKPVTGLTKSYDLSLNKDNLTNFQVLNLKGGFYQGFYKLFGYPYEVVPNRTELGYTLNFWIKKNEATLTGNTLNNDNFFFFMGSRAENKFWNIFSGETGHTTTTGVTLSSQTGSTNDVNGIGFYFNNDSIGYKNIINRQDESGNTLCYIATSAHTFYPDSNPWINLTIKFTRRQKLTLCDDGECKVWTPAPKLIKTYDAGCDEDIPDSQLGILQFFVNARPVFSVDIEEPIFRKLNVDKDVQQGVPYNISIGGGTQGLLETKTFDGPDLDDQNLFMYNNFGGSFNGSIGIASMYTYPLTISEIIRNFISKQTIYNRKETFGGAKIIISPDLINL